MIAFQPQAAKALPISPFGAEAAWVSPKHTNRLIGEKSPYLLQHAHNPVDWHAWKEEAFEKARREDKPIFLSIGYSTCHWCHVMERESFENEETAALLNAYFIPIKVDREERPDVDRVYMTFVQATTGSGGWPMSVWLTPDLQPFVGGTYFPPEDRYGRPGFGTVLRRLAELWRDERDRVLDQGQQITEMLRQYAGPRGEGKSPELEPLQTALAAVRQAAESFDGEMGGFGGAPKFPRPAMLDFLLAFYRREPASAEGQQAREMVFHTLRSMAAGGMHDHLGGGFHRYSVDRFWHVPHYEKMLYDQAQLVVTYLEAWQINGEPLFAATARDILDYVRRDMTSPEGAFFSAEDADSIIPGRMEKGEGAFYVWSKQEIDEALGGDAAAFNRAYGVEAEGNSPPGSDPHGELGGLNTLIRRDGEADEEMLARSRAILLERRSQRPRPHLDDKILAAWNGLMISAFARAAMALDDQAFADAARAAAMFIRGSMVREGRLLRSWREGPGPEGFAEDYAAMAGGAMDLYEATGEIEWLQWAVELQATLNELFLDREQGGYFSAREGDAGVIVRMKEDHDGAEPAASSLAARNAFRLARMLDGDDSEARRTVGAFAGQLSAAATSMPAMLTALLLSGAEPRQIVLAGEPSSPLARVARAMATPETVLLYAEPGSWLAERLPFIRTALKVDGKPAAYICENFTCQLPVTDPEALRKALR
ncbi:MAG TPA: thioredoxin domain-containing protein [Chthoniobacteraceae bacterium]|jgi:hypothetical protein|nr:thioredoxin domain-containing protein [Chthoniobacteraceae bacterium]